MIIEESKQQQEIQKAARAVLATVTGSDAAAAAVL
jgi:hypothetical protein